MKRKALVLALLTLIGIGEVSSLQSRPWRGGRRRHYPGWHHRYRPGLRRRHWWGGPGLHFGVHLGGPHWRRYGYYGRRGPRWHRERALDSMNLRWWEIQNNTGSPITIITDRGNFEIPSGRSSKVRRRYDFTFTVHISDRQSRTFETSDHFVTIILDSKGNLDKESWPSE